MGNQRKPILDFRESLGGTHGSRKAAGACIRWGLPPKASRPRRKRVGYPVTVAVYPIQLWARGLVVDPLYLCLFIYVVLLKKTKKERRFSPDVWCFLWKEGSLVVGDFELTRTSGVSL